MLILDILVDFIGVGTVAFVVFASVGIILADEADRVWDGAIVVLCDRPPADTSHLHVTILFEEYLNRPFPSSCLPPLL